MTTWGARCSRPRPDPISRRVTFMLLILSALLTVHADDKAIRDAVTFYASFDEEVKGDRGGGVLTPSTRVTGEKGKFTFTEGIDRKVFRIAKDKGISGGA